MSEWSLQIMSSVLYATTQTLQRGDLLSGELLQLPAKLHFHISMLLCACERK